jgi:hypothetical protein
MFDAAAVDPVDLDGLQRLNQCGYGFYRDVARTRADDLLVRSQAADALCRAAETVAASIQAAHADLPPLSREHPFPDAAALAAIRTLRALHDRIATVQTRLRGAAALPDRDFSRVVPSEAARQELVALDAALLARAVQTGGNAALIGAVETVLAAREAFASRGKSS